MRSQVLLSAHTGGIRGREDAGSELGLGAAAWRYDMHGERGLAAGGSRGVKGPRERGREGKTQARYAPNDGNS